MKVDADALYRSVWREKPRTDDVVGPRTRLALNLCPSDATTVLDVGCGRGQALAVLAKPGRVAVGVDISLVPLIEARRRGAVTVADAGVLPFRARTFEAVIALSVLEHLSDDRRALNSWVRVLGAGGTLVVSVPHRESAWGVDDERAGHVRRYERNGLQRLLTECHLRVVTVRFADFPFYALARWFFNRFGHHFGVVRTTGCIGRDVVGGSRMGRLALGCVTLVEGFFRRLPFGPSIVVAARKVGEGKPSGGVCEGETASVGRR